MRAILLCLVIAGCSRPAPKPLTSPSGAFAATAEVSGEEAGPARRGCVRLKVEDVRAASEMTFQTGASDGQKWAMAWSQADSLVLYSSDIGTRAYDVKGGRIIERAPDDAEKQVGREAYREKYGKPPRH